MNKPGLPILTYHSLDPSSSLVSTRLDWFIETLKRLRDAGRRAIDLCDWIESGRPLVENAFAIAFDDGYQNVIDAAEPLARHGWSATVFLVADLVGRENRWETDSGSIPRLPLLSWSEIVSLRSAGFRFGAHSKTHRRLDRLDETALVEELRGSREAIENALGEPCRLFAYPYGRSSRTVRRRAGELFSASFGTRLDRCRNSDRSHDLPRIDAYYLKDVRTIDRWAIGYSRAGLAARRSLRSLGRWGVDLSTIFS